MGNRKNKRVKKSRTPKKKQTEGEELVEMEVEIEEEEQFLEELPNKTVSEEEEQFLEEVPNKEVSEEEEQNEMQEEEHNEMEEEEHDQMEEAELEEADEQQTHTDTVTQRKRRRGATKMKQIAKDPNERLHVDFTDLGEPCGPGSVMLSSYLGPLLREHVHGIIDNWRKVTEDIRTVLWKSIKVS